MTEVQSLTIIGAVFVLIVSIAKGIIAIRSALAPIYELQDNIKLLFQNDTEQNKKINSLSKKLDDDLERFRETEQETRTIMVAMLSIIQHLLIEDPEQREQNKKDMKNVETDLKGFLSKGTKV